MPSDANEVVSVESQEQHVVQNSQFRALPTVLRLNIYSYLWNEGCSPVRVLIISNGKTDSFWAFNRVSLAAAAALMLTCRGLDAEVHDLLYSNTHFNIEVWNYSRFTLPPPSSGSKEFLRQARHVSLQLDYDTGREIARPFLWILRAVLEMLKVNEGLETFSLEVSTRDLQAACHDAIVTELADAEMEQAMLESVAEGGRCRLHSFKRVLEVMEKLLV